MVAAAPRLDSRVLALIDRIDDPKLPIAEVARRVGAATEEFGLTRPSYQAVRLAVHRRRLYGSYPGAGEVLLEIALRARPPSDLEGLLAGDLPRKRK